MSGPAAETRDGFRLEPRRGVWIVRNELLLEVAGVGHAFSTRRAVAREPCDVGGAGTQEPQVLERRRRVCAAAGLAARQPRLLRQVHGARVVSEPSGPGGGARGDLEAAADAVLAVGPQVRGRALGVRTADCVPVLLADEAGRAVAAVHAGWRGTAAGVLERAVAALEAAGVEPQELRAVLGPAIGPCCYEVGEEVLEAVERGSGVPAERWATRRRGARPRADLRRLLEIELRRRGLRPRSIARAPWCTSCRNDLFFSYRREGAAAGRQMAVIGWHPR